MATTSTDTKTFLAGSVSKRLILLNATMALIYFLFITFGFKHGNNWLFGFLIFGEAFHLFQVLGFCHTIWDKRLTAKFDPDFEQPVDIFITVCGEPVDIVRETAMAALAMDYPEFHVYLLNDGYVAKKDNWQEIITLATELGITAITRKVPGGAKAGNINNALAETHSPYFVVFDADHVPYTNFLRKTMGYFTDKKMGFVQSPQYYKNHAQNFVTQTAWDQQALFFGAIMSGKNRTNSAFMCGTNMALSREAIMSVGGIFDNIAEDFLTSLFVHAKGWNSVYVPEVIAEGLAPEDFLSYYKQQYRWTRGSLEVIFKYNPIFMRGMTWAQKFQYLASASYYLSGLIILIDLVIPLVFLYTGLTPIHTATMALALVFLPYITLNLYTLQKSSNFVCNFPAISFSISAFYIQLRAIYAVLTNQKTVFAVTPKSQQQGNFVKLATPHFVFFIVAIIGLVIGLNREGLSASLLANLSWVLVNAAVFVPFIKASLPEKKAKKKPAHKQTVLVKPTRNVA
jgi:cellulose synthase (UDP-forming)